MTRKFKVVRCPHCGEYTYLPMGGKRRRCPRCSAHVELHKLEGVVVSSAVEAQRLVQAEQYKLYGIQPPPLKALGGLAGPRKPEAEVLRLLRPQGHDGPGWHQLEELVNRCMETGLSRQLVLKAIESLAEAGFIEVREGCVRVVPLC